MRLSFHTGTGDLEISVNGALQARWLGDWAAYGCTKISGNQINSKNRIKTQYHDIHMITICSIGHINHISRCTS